MSDTVLELQNIKKYFPCHGSSALKRGELRAVDGVTLTVGRKKTVGLVGESGCGKTTLGRVILRLLPATEGEILLNGTNITHCTGKQLRAIRPQMQMIFQDPISSLNPRMRIIESVYAPMHAAGKSFAECSGLAAEVLGAVGITESQFYKYPHEMSGGQRQRVVIARAAILNPDLIVCDEPVSALDVSIRAQVLNLMKSQQQERGLSYLFISHDLSVVRYMCDSVCVMYLGRIVETADCEELFRNPVHPYTQALISAVPVPDVDSPQNRIILKGDLPSPMKPHLGCRFITRCPYATTRCGIQEPEIRTVSPGHMVYCWKCSETPE